MLHVVIPGDPVPQGRAQAGRWKAKDGRTGIAMRDPAKSRNWKSYAAGRMEEALHAAAPAWPGPDGHAQAVSLEILCVFPCPVSEHRKREPTPRRWKNSSRDDCDNLAKAVMDAGNGILWNDDGQVVDLRVRKIVGAQGEASRVEVWVRPAAEVPEPASVQCRSVA